MGAREGAQHPTFRSRLHANVAAVAPMIPVSRPSFCRVPPGMRSVPLYRWHLCGWIERIPGGTQQNDGLGNRNYGGYGRESSVEELRCVAMQALSMGYDGLWPNTSQPNIYATMTPTTPVELGEGFVIANERTITSRAGSYQPPQGAGPYRTSWVHTYLDCYLESVVEGGTTVVVEGLAPRAIVVIVWKT